MADHAQRAVQCDDLNDWLPTPDMDKTRMAKTAAARLRLSLPATTIRPNCFRYPAPHGARHAEIQPMRVFQCVCTVSSVLLPLLTSLAPAGAAVKLTYPDMLAHLTDLDRLPVIEPGVYCRQFSSYDRSSRYDAATDKYIAWDANGDAGQYIRVEPGTGEAVMAEMDGPGCIFRIWSANPQGNIRFYLDGDLKPTYEWPFHKLCSGAIEPFINPLAWTRDPNNPQSASNIYLPIPFARHCKVTSIVIEPDGRTKRPGHYYIIDYRVFPKDWQIDSFKLPLSDADRKAVVHTAKRWAAGPDVDAAIKPELLTIQPGGAKTVIELTGPGVIERLYAKLKPTEKWGTRKVLIQAYWDGQEKPSINCPIGDFFGEPKDVPYRSYAMSIGEEMNCCHFRMPFRKSARIVLVNEGSKPAEVRFAISHRQREVPETWAQFHAKWRGELSSKSFDYPLLEATGTGKLVGICLFPDNIAGGWWGEGDEKAYVDGEKFPSWFGTGSEDYFGDAWGIRYFEHPSHGHPQRTIERMQGCYRWHLGDNIPFYKSFLMTIENYTGVPDAMQRNDYFSVAYWYQLPGGSDFFTDTPVADRLPRGYVAAGAVEVERYVTAADLDQGVTVVEDADLPQPLSSGKGVRLSGKVGSTATIRFPADTDDRYIVTIHPARDARASEYEVLVDGRKAKPQIPLHRGLNALGIRFTGKPVEGERCELIVDYVSLAVYRKMITDWMVIGPFPNSDRKGMVAVYPPERRVDLNQEHEGIDGQKVRWQKVSKQDGMMVFNQLFKPFEDCVIYAACVVNAPGDRKETMLVGSDDGVKVWINGNVVWENPIDRALAADSDRFEVELRRGSNLVLMKVQNQLRDVGLAARFLDAQDELTYALPE